MSIFIPKQPYGITLPISHGTGGYFNQCFDVLSQVKTNLTNLLLTKPGERRMNTDFGSNLHSVLFEFDNDELPTIADSIIRKDIERWMPYVEIRSISVDTRNDLRDIYVIHITIKFTVSSLGISTIQLVDFSLTADRT